MSCEYCTDPDCLFNQDPSRPQLKCEIHVHAKVGETVSVKTTPGSTVKVITVQPKPSSSWFDGFGSLTGGMGG